MRFCNLIACLATIACNTAVFAESPNSVEFRYAPRAGEAMRHRTVMNSVGTLGMASGVPGARFTQSTTQDTDGLCKEVAPDGSAVFELTLSRIAMRMNTPGMNITYDSRTFEPEKTENPAIRMIGRLYSGLVGSKLAVTFNPQGSPSQVAGMREAVIKAIEPLKKELAKEPAGLFINPIIDNLAAAFDDAMISDQMKSFYRFLPTEKGPIAVGRKWASDWDMELPFLKTSLNAKGQYELLGVETFRGHACAKIAIKESFAMNTTAQKGTRTGTKPAPALGKLLEKMDMSLNASNGEGIAYWDYQKGNLVQLRQTQRIVMTVKFRPSDIMFATAPASDTAPEGEQTPQTFTQNFTSSIQVDLLEGEADEPATQKAAKNPADR